jgi:hypothetical protein
MGVVIGNIVDGELKTISYRIKHSLYKYKFRLFFGGLRQSDILFQISYRMMIGFLYLKF